MNYTVASPADAPSSLTYGPAFFELAAAQLNKSQVTLGLNRQLDNESNTLEAAVRAKEAMHNLYAVELGNEPDRTFLSFLSLSPSSSSSALSMYSAFSPPSSPPSCFLL